PTCCLLTSRLGSVMEPVSGTSSGPSSAFGRIRSMQQAVPKQLHCIRTQFDRHEAKTTKWRRRMQCRQQEAASLQKANGKRRTPGSATRIDHAPATQADGTKPCSDLSGAGNVYAKL